MGGILLRLDWELLREHVLTTGECERIRRRAASGEDGTRRFWFSLGIHSGVACVVDHGSGHSGYVPSQERRHEEVLVFFGDCSGVGCVLTTGVVMRRRAVSGETARGGFGYFHLLSEIAPECRGLTTGAVMRLRASGEDGTRIAFCFCGLWEVLCVSLRAVAGAGMRSRASRDAFPSGAWERHNVLFGFVGGAVAVCFEGCCGSMCWPTGAAARGAAARGVRGIGGLLRCRCVC